MDCLAEQFKKLLALSLTNPKVEYKTIQLKCNANIQLSGGNRQIVHKG